MSQVIAQSMEAVPSPYRIRWTRANCEDFQARGLLQPGNYELIEGEIIRKREQKRPHSAAVGRLNAWCISVFTGDFVQTQASINVALEDNPTSEPEPDVFVLNRSIEHFPVAFPTPDDLLLVAEVSDTTLAFDLSTKAVLYARARIVEYWVLDVVGRTLTAHRNPIGDRYQNVIRYSAYESISTLARPDATVIVSALLPPLSED